MKLELYRDAKTKKIVSMQTEAFRKRLDELKGIFETTLEGWATVRGCKLSTITVTVGVEAGGLLSIFNVTGGIQLTYTVQSS